MIIKKIKILGYRLILALQSILKKIEQSIMPSEMYIINTMTNGFILSRCLSVIAELEIANIINNNSKHISIIAEEARCNEDALYRIMRCLSSMGIFAETKNKGFKHTRLSEVLKSDSKKSVLNWLKYFNSKEQFEQWKFLVESIITGKDTYKINKDTTIFDWLKNNPSSQNLFNLAMDNISNIVNDEIISSFSFSNNKKIIDIGGGTGNLANKLIEKINDVEVTILDTFKNTFNNKVKFLQGDFFKSIPNGFDIYILKSVLHDWTDEQVVQILKNIKKSMNVNSKLLVIEMVINSTFMDITKVTDIAMLALSGGRERTINEFNELINESGMKIQKIHHTSSPFTIIEIQLLT